MRSFFNNLFGTDNQKKTTPPSQSASNHSNADSKSSDVKPNAVTIYKGKLGEAWPDSHCLFTPLRRVVDSYVCEDVGVDLSQYTDEQLAEFTLGGEPIALFKKIGTHILAGEGKKALALIQKYPFTLEHFTHACDPWKRLAYGTPLRLAAAAGNPKLVIAIRSLKTKDGKLLLPNDSAEAQLAAQFPPDWIEKQKVINAQQIKEATHFRDRLAEKRLPADLTPEQALIERKEIINEYRISLRPKLNDPVRTIGLLDDPQSCMEIRQLFIDSEKDLGGLWSHETRLLWANGFQSRLAAGSAFLAQILIGGANKYSVSAK